MTSTRPLRLILIAAAFATLALSLASAHGAQRSDSTSTRVTQDKDYAIVELNGEPLAT